jgi:hypothetical protein
LDVDGARVVLRGQGGRGLGGDRAARSARRPKLWRRTYVETNWTVPSPAQPSMALSS